MNLSNMFRVYLSADGGAAAPAGNPPAQNPPNPNPPAAGTPPPGAPPAAPTGGDWMGDLAPESRGYIENKGWKKPAQMLESYQNLEKLRGIPEERLLALPMDAADKAAWDKIYTRLGRPEKPEGYKIVQPKEGGSPEFEQFARGAFHELGLTGTQGEKLTEKWNAFVESAQAKQVEDYKTSLAQKQTALKKEWGAAYEQNLEIARNAAKTFGVDGDTFSKLEQVMGFDGVVKHFEKIGRGLGEGKFIDGKTQNPNLRTPGQAKAKLDQLMSDQEWVNKFLSGDKAALAERDLLIEQASAG